MDRAKAIEILRGMVKDRIGTDDLDTTIRIANEKDAVEMAITDMKSCSHANREWIRCNEQMPEKSGTYLTAQSMDGSEGLFALPMNICTYRYSAQDGRWHGCQVKSVIENVVFWMPLPPPPRGKVEYEWLKEWLYELLNSKNEEPQYTLLNYDSVKHNSVKHD